MSRFSTARQHNGSGTAEELKESSYEHGVTVVIPCLNEHTTIAEAVAQAKAAFANWPAKVEVLVADNGSTDGSAELARDVGARVVGALERGYGAALQTGFAAARTPYKEHPWSIFPFRGQRRSPALSNRGRSLYKYNRGQ